MSIPPPPPYPGPDEPTAGSASLASPSIHDARMLAARVPAELLPLARLAYNYWWSWQPEGDALFRSVDPERWEHCGHNPVRLLFESPRLAQAARRPDLIARAHALEEAMRADLARPFSSATPATPANPVAFFCAEFAIHSSLPIYSGGLGVLAGDFLKEASDRALPLVGVGLFYHLGFFHQRLDLTGWQHESWTRSSPEYLGITLCTNRHGTPLRFRVSLRGHDVTVGVWRADVGRVPLYLLDTDLPENAPVDRFVTSQLYVGDRDFRLMQYALLGIGGIRALSALGIDPGVVHLNEGHAALSCLELARPAIEGGRPPLEALAEVQKRVVFTTHTPVAAGNESYRPEEVQRILPDLHTRFGIEMRQLLDLGSSPGSPGSLDPQRPFGMTVFALRTSRRANGVSRKHGEVSRGMWQGLWPDRGADDVPITHVTNGVHLRTWMAAPMRALLDRHLGANWIEHTCDPVVWDAIDTIPDEELWAVRNQMRAVLVNYVRQRSVGDRLLRGEPLEYVEGAARTFDPGVLTIGFARRVTAYKRLNLLVHDPVRAIALLTGPRPIQVVMAGNSHPRDEEGKRLIQRIFDLKSVPQAGARVVFLEDYETRTAQALVAGCDVWVNVPRPPLEASGTSGMKAGMNGNLNLSVLDGWWCEGSNDNNGWAIHSDPALDHATQDARDADRLYSLLATEVVPMFHDRDAGGLPRRWIQRVKASLRSLPPQFNAGRMVNDYLLKIYRGV